MWAKTTALNKFRLGSKIHNIQNLNQLTFRDYYLYKKLVYLHLLDYNPVQHSDKHNHKQNK